VLKRLVAGASWASMRVGLPVAAVALVVAFGAGFSAGDLTHGGQKALTATRAPTTTTPSTTIPPPAPTTTAPAPATTTTAAAVSVAPTTPAPALVATTIPPCNGGVTSTITVSSVPTIGGSYDLTVSGTVRNGRTDPIDNVIVTYGFPGLSSNYQGELATPTPTPIAAGGSAAFSHTFNGFEFDAHSATVTFITYSDTSIGYGCGNGSST